MLHRLAVAVLLAAGCSSTVPAQDAVPGSSTRASTGSAVTDPTTFLGRPLGVDFDLADWEEVGGYYRRLATESPNVLLVEGGTTTDGRDFPVLVISDPANLANLDRIRAHAAVLADPRERSVAERKAAIDHGKTILFVSCGMHSTETAGPQFSMAFAHALATSPAEPYASARRELVTLVYTTNPDGVARVTDWYRRTVGTPHEASGLLELYQHYAGHDNNRDWFMLTQAETRIVTRMLYQEWHPQVYWDVHEQGSRGERLFVPPFRDPLNPNLDPAIIAGIDALGSRALLDLTRAGYSGISTGVSYDMWWNGGNRNVPVRHNIIGLLTEAASVNLASPIFLPKRELRGPRGLGGDIPSNRFPDPWPGGWWRLSDIIDYEMAFGRSLIGSLAREGAVWRSNAMEAAERAVAEGRAEAPRGWILPSDNRDPDAVHRLVEILMLGGVEVRVCAAPVEVDGRAWPEGSILIRRDQPYGAHVKDLMDVQRYPEGDAPYDNAGWTLPFLLGVHRVELMSIPDVDAPLAATADDAVAGFAGDPRLAATLGAPVDSLRHSGTWRDVVDKLEAGGALSVVVSGPEAGLVNGSGPSLELTRLPRIGVYAPWDPSMDEGWLRWMLDTWDVPYQRVRNEMLRAGALRDLVDVLVVPSVSGRAMDEGRADGSVPAEFSGGLAPEGAVAIEEFVRDGGRLVCLGASGPWAVDLFQLPVADATRGDEEFSCPGGVLRTVPEGDSRFVADLPLSLPVFFSRSGAYRVAGDSRDVEVLLRYAPQRTLLSGWIKGEEAIQGRAAWVRAEVGDGSVHLIGFRPHYRGWTQGTFGVLFRAMLF